jgi:hypothetical protein
MNLLLGAHKFPVNMKSKYFVYARQYIDSCRGEICGGGEQEEV